RGRKPLMQAIKTTNRSTTALTGGATPPLADETLDVTFSEDALSTLVRLFRIHGDIFRVFSPALRRELYVVSHPDYVKHVLVSNHRNYTKGIGIERVQILLGKGLMVSEGDLWRGQRKMIQPSFHRTSLAGMARHIASANQSLVDAWVAAATQRQPINLT